MAKDVVQQDEPLSRLSREDWVAAALHIFVWKGIDAVRVEPLAQSLNVTKGSFYWHFKNRKELHEAIIQHWGERCTRTLTESIAKSTDIIDVVLNVFCMWMRDEPFSPRLDAGIRDWARRSEAVKVAVQQADSDRTKALEQAFVAAGYTIDAARIRARALYFIQIGYYEASIKESWAQRIENWREYVKVITGLELRPGRLREFREQNFTAAELSELDEQIGKLKHQ